MKVEGIEIRGRSVSGYATAIALPEMGICFDMGMAHHDAVQAQHVMITHGHLDHMGDIARHAYIRGMTGMSPSTFYVPEHLVDSVRGLFAFWANVQEARKAPLTVHSVKSGNKPLQIEGTNKSVVSWETSHRIKSQGYTVYENRKRLLPEHLGKEGRELGALRKSGVQIEEEVAIPMVSFTGDTRIAVLDRNTPALQSKVLIMECTFLSDVEEEEANRKGHTHIDQLAKRVDRLDQVGSLVLCHFSKRYTNQDVEREIAKLPDGLRQKTTFLPVGS
jgi:ribonuclease Z